MTKYRSKTILLWGFGILVVGLLIDVLVPAVPWYLTSANLGNAEAVVFEIVLQFAENLLVPVGTALLAAGIVLTVLDTKNTAAEASTQAEDPT